MDPQFINAEENSMTKRMEISDDNQSTASKKRKANDSSPITVDEGDGEQGGEESDVSSREEYQQWDVDSFDDGDEFKPKKRLDPNDEEAQKMRRYRLEMYQSKGFNIHMENYPGHVAYRELYPINLDEPFGNTGLTGGVYMQNMVNLAVEKYNAVKGLTLTCEYIVRAIINAASGIKSYITFMARETPDGDLVEYQAKTDKRKWQKNPHAIFCRPTPKPIDIKVPVDEDWSSTDSSSRSDTSGRESDQEWGVDSLDDESGYKPPRRLPPTKEEIEKMSLYRPQMYQSKGFNVDGERYSGKVVYFSPVVLDERFWTSELTGRQYMQNMVELALERYNTIKGSSVTCESIVRANLTRVNGWKSYITFLARESPHGDLVEYQAKTEKKFWQKKAHAILCRPSPNSKGN